MLCAERFLAEGKAAEAAEIYDEVRKAEVPKQRILEATRGAISPGRSEGIPLLVEQFRSPDKGLFQIALEHGPRVSGRRSRQGPGGRAGSRNARSGRRLIIQAMADRKETVVLSAVLKAAGSGPKPVRLAAIGALGRVGDASCLATLLETALEADADWRKRQRRRWPTFQARKSTRKSSRCLPKPKEKCTRC